jgi:hypothetical protein
MRKVLGFLLGSVLANQAVFGADLGRPLRPKIEPDGRVAFGLRYAYDFDRAWSMVFTPSIAATELAQIPQRLYWAIAHKDSGAVISQWLDMDRNDLIVGTYDVSNLTDLFKLLPNMKNSVVIITTDSKAPLFHIDLNFLCGQFPKNISDLTNPQNEKCVVDRSQLPDLTAECTEERKLAERRLRDKLITCKIANERLNRKGSSHSTVIEYMKPLTVAKPNSVDRSPVAEKRVIGGKSHDVFERASMNITKLSLNIGFMFKWFFLLISSFVVVFPSLVQAETCRTKVTVVDLANYSFTADSFLAEKSEVKFVERPSKAKYQQWAQEVVDKVNAILPADGCVPAVKIKLAFKATVKDSQGKKAVIPISNIESYQEPQTQSIRLGMMELADSKIGYQMTVAHEYSHLVFERVSRSAGKTTADKPIMDHWVKSVYEGYADALATIAYRFPHSGDPKDWGTRHLLQYKTLDEAKNARSELVKKAEAEFRKRGLIPKYPIYSDWLDKIGKYIAANGNTDPYAEGTWLAGQLYQRADASDSIKNIAQTLVSFARTGVAFDNTQAGLDAVLKAIANN